MLSSAVALTVLICASSSALAQVSIGISSPGVNIGINMPVYPQLVRVPNYPVYYAPGVQSNYFFYDGMYWVYEQDNWYASSWYNGPWAMVGPQAVPVFVLRIPVRYYRNPPQYFRGWRSDAPPRWNEHWGNQWAQQRSGWDRWDHRSMAAPAPLPAYQRQYSGDRYPHAEQQHALQSSNYRYQPRDAVVRQQFQQQSAPARAQEQQGRPALAPRQQQDVQPQHVQVQQQQQQQQQQRVQPAPQPQEAGRAQRGERAHEGVPGPRNGRGQEKNRDNEDENGRQGNKK